MVLESLNFIKGQFIIHNLEFKIWLSVFDDDISTIPP